MDAGGSLPGLDPARPTAARVYDYLLGGKDNFAADRRLAAECIARDPGLRERAQLNRSFVGMAVARAAGDGRISQYLDLGSGLPTAMPVHQIARSVRPGCRVAYVDNDSQAYRHASALLATAPGLAAVRADLTDPGSVISSPVTRAVIDFAEPVAVILGAVLHFLDAGQAREVTAAYMDAVPSGSWLVISCARYEDQELLDALLEISPLGYRNHTPAEFASFFAGTVMVPPGIAEARRWVARVDDGGGRGATWIMAGAAVKP